MSCPTQLVSYAEFQALKAKCERLKQQKKPQISQKDIEKAVIGFLVSAGGFEAIRQGMSSMPLGALQQPLGPVIDLAETRLEQRAKLHDQRMKTLLEANRRKRVQQIDDFFKKANAKDQNKAIFDAIENTNKRQRELEGGLTQTRNRANSAVSKANDASKKATNALGKADKAISSASNAASIGKSALTKIGGFLNALSVIGGVAGLLSLFGLFKSVFPRLDANDKRLDNLNQGLSDNLSRITVNRGIANRAEQKADQAQASADDAATEAQQAGQRARDAERAADRAQFTADNASSRAHEAAEQARAAQRQADKALNEANANSTEIDELRQEQTKMNDSQFTTLRQQNDTTIRQNTRITDLLTNLPTNPNGDLKVPPELLAIAPAVNRIDRNTSTIARNTTPGQQVANSKAGTCDAFSPSQCGDQAISRHTRPIRKRLEDIVDKIAALNTLLLENLGRKIDRLSSAVNKFQSKVFRKFDQTWDFLKLDRVLNLINTAVGLHNAAMLSRNLAESIVGAFDGIFALTGLKDAEGNPFKLSGQIADGIEGLIDATIGQEAAQGISERWNRWNRIISAAAGVVMAVRSVQWAIAEGVEIVGDWIAKIGNGLREGGAVEDRQWPWMKEGLEIKQFSRLNRFNDGLESAENITNQVYATVSAGVEIGDAVNEVRESKQRFDQQLAIEEEQAEAELAQRNLESQSPNLVPSDLIRFEAEELEG